MAATKKRKKTEKKVTGRPAFEPQEWQREMLPYLIAGGFKQIEIAKCFKTTTKTLSKHFPEEIEEGNYKKLGRVVKKLFDLAMEGDFRACAKIVDMSLPLGAFQQKIKLEELKHKHDMKLLERKIEAGMPDADQEHVPRVIIYEEVTRDEE